MIKKDTSPDMSFKTDTKGLQKNTLYRIQHKLFEGMENLFEKDAARFICSLQGLLNRDYETNGNILMYLQNDGVDEFWLDYITGEGKSFSHLNIVDIDSFDTFLNTFKEQILSCGTVLWDEKVPATANVAATIATTVSVDRRTEPRRVTIRPPGFVRAPCWGIRRRIF